jgi:hypothetical protein
MPVIQAVLLAMQSCRRLALRKFSASDRATILRLTFIAGHATGPTSGNPPMARIRNGGQGKRGRAHTLSSLNTRSMRRQHSPRPPIPLPNRQLTTAIPLSGKPYFLIHNPEKIHLRLLVRRLVCTRNSRRESVTRPFGHFEALRLVPKGNRGTQSWRHKQNQGRLLRCALVA